MHQTIKIERMAYSANAVGHLSCGKTVFVAGAAPGDIAEIEVVSEKPTYAQGKLLRIVEAGPHRTCEHWAEPAAASVAPWQHVVYDAQLKEKRNNIVHAIATVGGLGQARAQEIVKPCIPSPEPWAFRNKVELAGSWSKNNGFQLGFHEIASNNVLPAKKCCVAHKEIEGAPKALAGALRFLQGAQDLGIFRVGVRHSKRTKQTEIALWTAPSAFPRAKAVQVLKSAVNPTSIVRVLASEGAARKVKKVEVLTGTGNWSEILCGAKYTVSAPSFFQVNTAQAETLISLVVKALGGNAEIESVASSAQSNKMQPQKGNKRLKLKRNWQLSGLSGLKVADLYAGCGTFSVALAKAGASVVAVEAAKSSVRDLRRNARANDVNIEVVGGDAARELQNLTNIDALVVDPPRAGLAKSVPADITKPAPKKVIYVSCNPATLARDIARFRAVGYELQLVQPVDMFPQTYHVETVVLMSKVQN